MEATKTALLVLNQQSRRGNGPKQQAVDCLQQHNLTVDAVEFDKPQEIPGHIQRHRAHVDLIVVAGGDGTLNAALPGLMNAGLPVGILPLGTANDLARTLNIPKNIPRACAIIGAGRLRKIDISRVNDRLFFNVANIGLGVQVGMKLSREGKRRWGIFSYVRAVNLALRQNRSFTAQLTCDEKTFNVKSIQISVGGGRFYGGGTAIKEDADIDDGKLDLYSIKPMSLWRLMALAPALRAGKHHRFDAVIPARGEAISVNTKRPLTINADGEPISQTPADFSIIQAGLSIYAPGAS